MKATLASCLLLIFITPAFAEPSWICITERQVMVAGDEDGITYDSHEADFKYVVSAAGLKMVGSDSRLIDGCSQVEALGLVHCESISPPERYLFDMKDTVFSLSLHSVALGGLLVTETHVGKCTQL